MVVAEAPAGSMKLRARVRLADALFNQKRYAEASGHYETAIAGGEEAAARWAQLQLGWCAFRAGNPDGARAQWDQLRRRWPKSPEAPVALGDIGETLFGQERFADAEEAFRRLSREVPPTSPLAESAALRVGDCLYNAKSYEAAVLAYREFAVRYPESKRLIEALYGMQWAYMQLGDYERARREASSFLERYPESGMAAEVQQMVAESYRRERKPREAIAEYRELIKKYPDSGLAMQARMKLGEAQEEAGSFAEAEATYKEFLEKHPDNPLAGDAAFRLSVVRYATGNIEGAVEGFTAIAGNSANARAPEALYNLVLCHKKLGREEAMMSAVRQLDEKFPATRAAAQGHLSAAYHFADSGKRDTAVAQFRAASDSSAGDVASEARYALGDLAAQQGDSELALNWYGKGYADLPRGGEWSVQCAFEAANLLGQKKRNDEAVAVLRRVLEKSDAEPAWIATAQVGIGQAFEAEGKNEEARAMYAECLRGSPPADLKARAEERLNALGGAPPEPKKQAVKKPAPSRTPAVRTPAVKTPAVTKPAVKKPAAKKPASGARKKGGSRG
jgi:TolA-binding protein